jgi:hypothetical protein
MDRAGLTAAGLAVMLMGRCALFMGSCALLMGSCALLLGGCAPRLPVPELATHEGDTPVTVPHPPPAARSEMIPAQPDERAVWVDGYWMWKGSDYHWNAGRWVVPGPGMTYAPAALLRLRNGELVFYAPKWIRGSEKR